MYNAFLVIRTVFFGLLLYLHVLMLVCVSWNIVAARSQGISSESSAELFTLMRIERFSASRAYLAECICAKARPARVRIECIWTACMSTIQLGEIPVHHANAPGRTATHVVSIPVSWALCASSSLLVNISWLATLIILSYCLMINVAATAHAALLPDIWNTPVSFVPWFRLDAEARAPAPVSYIPTLKHAKTASSSYIVVLETDSNRPTWARQQHIRRGVDQPFGKPPVVLAPPPKARSRHAVTSRDAPFVEKGEAQETWSREKSIRAWQASSVFPQGIANLDQPIPRPKLSEWVRADVIKGSVHRESAASS
ncbi:hypothetical protein JVU11DRAFT_890 [Chiua virens]|nr:hypothetical protein JVU11DRAFT_890 [Chiua virens]